MLQGLVATSYVLVPLVRTLLTACDTAVLPRPPTEPRWRTETRWRTHLPVLGESPSGGGVVLAAAPPAVSGDVAQGLPDWAGRALTRLWRLSAWRNARSRTSVVPAFATAPRSVGATSRATWLPQSTRPGPTPQGPSVRVSATSDGRTDREPNFPIDVVYTWVDDRDPVWRARYTDALRSMQLEGLDDEAASPARFYNRDELRYSLRSLAQFAPFVRNVHIVTAGQVPTWLDTEVPNLRIVPHEDILGPDCLPTFNSHAIESRLHHIPGLAEHYLYLNDDFFFGRRCQASMFFTADGRPRFFPDQRAMVPDGPCTPADRPVDSASKNTREIMAAEFDLLVRYKMQHVPYPQRRSILHEMEQRFRPVFKQTARNPFRHYTDVNIPSCFSHYYGFATGAACPGRISGSYINIGNPWAQLTMRRLLRRADRDAFCLNDTPMSPRRRAIVDAGVRVFLDAYFPFPSPFERDGGASPSPAPEADHVGEAVRGR